MNNVQIDKAFNLVAVHPIMHYLLHFLRFIEFRAVDDYRLFNFSLPSFKKALYAKTKTKINLEKQHVGKLILIYVKHSDILYEIWRDYYFKKLPLEIQELFLSEMRWKFKDRTIIIPANTVKTI